MYTATSSSKNTTDKRKLSRSRNFVFNGDETGETSFIKEDLLDNDLAAEERAKSEFLKNAYGNRYVNFSTFRNDFDINDVINIAGLPYLVKHIQTKIDMTSIINIVKGVRYE